MKLGEIIMKVDTSELKDISRIECITQDCANNIDCYCNLKFIRIGEGQCLDFRYKDKKSGITTEEAIKGFR